MRRLPTESSSNAKVLLDHDRLRADKAAAEDAEFSPVNGSGTGTTTLKTLENVKVPLPKVAEKPVPFPVKELPSPVSDYIRESAAATGFDESYIALPLLAAIASIIGNTRRIELKPGWYEPPVLWVLPIGESGSGKSPGFDLGIQPLKEIQSEKLTAWKIEMVAYESELQSWMDADRKIRGDKPQPPVCERHFTNDVTLEGLARLLSENKRGILVARDELSGWFNSFDAYRSGKGGDLGHFLSMYRADNLIVDRKTGTKSL